MPLPIKKHDVAERLRNYTLNNYLYLGSIVKGIALYFATLALMQIFTEADWKRAPLWVAPFAAILVSYMTWGRGVLVTNSRSNIADAVFPLLMGIVEFFLFGVLLSNKDHPHFWLNWFLFMS